MASPLGKPLLYACPVPTMNRAITPRIAVSMFVVLLPFFNRHVVAAETDEKTGIKITGRPDKRFLFVSKSVAARLIEYRGQNSGLIADSLIQEEGLKPIRLLHQAVINGQNDVAPSSKNANAKADAKADTNKVNDERVAQFLSSPGLQLYTASGVGVPLLTEGRSGRQQALRTVDALLVGGIVETALKRITRQKRPTGSGYGFPSGHATASFVVATMQSHYHPKQSFYWYTGAALISASRVKLRRHYVRDVLAGALIGYSISRWQLSRSRGLILSPFIRSNEENISNEMRRDRHIQSNKFSWHFSKSF